MKQMPHLRCVLDRLTGAPHEVPPGGLAEPWRSLYDRVGPCHSRLEAEYRLRGAIGDLPGADSLVRLLMKLLPADDRFVPYPSLEDMASRLPPLEWLWPGWIPRGMVTLLGAAPGAGKSLLALDLARRLIHGPDFPDGAPVACPGSTVVVVDAEGTPALLNERAAAWRIDRRFLYLLHADEPGIGVDLGVPDDQQALRSMCSRLRPALVIVDSLGAASAHGESSLIGARAVLGFLAALSQEYGLALLLIHHLRKPTRSAVAPAPARVAADDLRGSSHISAAARSVLALSLLAESPSLFPAATPVGAHGVRPSNGPRRLEVVKTNLSRQPPPLIVVLEETPAGLPVLRYRRETPAVPEPEVTRLCALWLVEYLAGAGEARPKEILAAASQAGFGRTLVYLARRALGAHIIEVGHSLHDPARRWRLAGAQDEPPAADEPPTSDDTVQGG